MRAKSHRLKVSEVNCSWPRDLKKRKKKLERGISVRVMLEWKKRELGGGEDGRV